MENTYLIVKSLHIISVISWMAGLLYLPRIFVYHTKAKIGSELDTTLQIMERKLLRFIMNPAMILSFIFGFWLIHFIGFSSGGWLHAKILLVLILAGFHGFLSKCRKNFASGNNKKSDKFYRIANEVPTLLMIAIVLLVVIKPF
ncbi:MAG: putative membrane protein [Rickettsiales bacterium]|jgi:putative membrane protein